MTKWEKEIMLNYFRMVLDKRDVIIDKRDEEDDDIDWTEIGEVENE